MEEKGGFQEKLNRRLPVLLFEDPDKIAYAGPVHACQGGQIQRFLKMVCHILIDIVKFRFSPVL